MFLLTFYRLYCAAALGSLAYFFAYPSLWTSLAVAIVVRVAWYFMERFIKNLRIGRWFDLHQSAFKELCGPYGIRLVNKAESDPSIRASLAEVFTPDLKKLQENVKNLETMDVIFKAGMRPDGDAWQLHDLKLKYGKHRLEKISR
jgi:hypothetical protein